MKDCEFSICIPSYNRANELCILIDSIASSVRALDNINTTYTEIEILICLDGSTDASQELLEQKITDYPCAIRYLWQENSGLASARNTLISNSNGKVVWLLDDDMCVSIKALACHLEFSHSDKNILVGPCTIQNKSGTQRFYNSRWEELAKNNYKVAKPNQMSFANTSFRKSLLMEYPFNSEFVGFGFEDYELAIRLLNINCNILFSWDAEVEHCQYKNSLRTLRDAREEGVNRVKLYNLHPIDGNFAVTFSRTKFQELLRFFTHRKMCRTMVFISYLFYFLHKLSVGKLSIVFRRISYTFALHSGIAKQGGKVILT